MPSPQPKFRATVTMKAEILDDRFQHEIDAHTRELMRQTSAYIEVAMQTQLLTRLTKGMPANLAQYAIDVFIDELKHVYVQIGRPEMLLLEAPPQLDLPQPVAALPDVEEATVVNESSDPLPSE